MHRDSVFLSELTTEIANNNKMRGVESVRSYDDPQYTSQITRAVTVTLLHEFFLAPVGALDVTKCDPVSSHFTLP